MRPVGIQDTALAISYTYDGEGNVRSQNGLVYGYDGLDRLTSAQVPGAAGGIRIVSYAYDKEMVVAGTSNRTYAKGTVREFHWHTDEYATWYWDHIAFVAGEVQTFTGKPEDGITDLYYFGARFYDPGAGRFISQDPARQGINWYLYCGDNPLRYVDPDGNTFWDILDVASFSLSLTQMIRNPSWENAGWLALDTIGLLPLLPSVGTVARGAALISKLDDAIDVAKVAGKIDDIGDAAKATTTILEGQGFKSFAAFKRAMGPAGEGMEWHHVVEQCRVGQFGAEAMHNTSNIVRLPAPLNARLNALYSSIRPRITHSTTMTVRQWLAGQSFEAQYEFGLRAIENVLNGVW